MRMNQCMVAWMTKDKNMNVTCTLNNGFVNNLTVNKKYEVIEETKHGYLIQDDLGIIWEYSKSRFNESFNKK